MRTAGYQLITDVCPVFLLLRRSCDMPIRGSIHLTADEVRFNRLVISGKIDLDKMCECGRKYSEHLVHYERCKIYLKALKNVPSKEPK